MDPSTSTEFDPVLYALKGHRIPVEDLSPQDWAYILEDVVARLKPQLQYMDGFRRMERPTDVWTQHIWLGEESFLVPVPERALWRFIADITFLVPDSDTPYAWRSILLDRNGSWVLASYMRLTNSARPIWNYIGDQELMANMVDMRLAHQGQVGYTILRGLTGMVRRTVLQQEQRLADTRKREQWMNDIMNRLQS
jgi:hypothetical protein